MCVTGIVITLLEGQLDRKVFQVAKLTETGQGGEGSDPQEEKSLHDEGRGRKLSRRGALPDERAWSAADERAHTEQEESICAPWQLIPPSPPLVSCLSGAQRPCLQSISSWIIVILGGWVM